MKKIKKIIIFACIILVILVIMNYSNNNLINQNTFLEYDIENLSKEKQSLLQNFYDESSVKVSKGKLVDLKYNYYNSIYDSSFGLVKKTNDTLPNLKMTVFKGNGEKIGECDNYSTKEAQKKFSYISNIYTKFDGSLLWSSNWNSLRIDEDLYSLKIIVSYDGGEETHYLETKRVTDVCKNGNEYYKNEFSGNVKITAMHYKIINGKDKMTVENEVSAYNGDFFELIIKDFIENSTFFSIEGYSLYSKNIKHYIYELDGKSIDIKIVDVLYRNGKTFWIFTVFKDNKLSAFEMEVYTKEVNSICNS